jgi:UDP-N-acetylmuramoylalanine--D-glutamate ligase
MPEGPYLVVGLGEAGQAAVDALRRIRPSERIVAYDGQAGAVPKRVRRALRASGVELRLGGELPQDLGPPPRTLIKSPGVRPDAPLLRWARQEGIEVLDEVELGWRQAASPMIAVTGTNGKTTTATLAAAVLSSSGFEAVLAGNADTAPPLSAVTGDPDLIVCEISSFQLEGCAELMPEVAVFTNLSHEHLARHGSMDRYGEVKRSLFIRGGSAVRLAVVDTIGEFGQRLAREIEQAGGWVVRVGLDSRADYRIGRIHWDLRRAVLELDTPAGGASFETRLPGFYNARNAAVVVALSDLLGCDRASLAETLAGNPGAAGRFEHIREGQDADLILDTACTPAAVEQFLIAARSGMRTDARLHAVLGLLGNPDPPQRRAIGRVARRLCDRLVLTAGSFRRSPPLRTLELLVDGASSASGAEVTVVPGRKRAIDLAVGTAGPDDVVAILGRGNVVESVKHERIDDRTALCRAARLSRLGSPGPERAGEAARGQLPLDLQQRGVGGEDRQSTRGRPDAPVQGGGEGRIDRHAIRWPFGVLEAHGELGGTATGADDGPDPTP